MRINTNVSAMNAMRNLGNTNSEFAKSITQLSTGLRINSAADDAAGLQIATRLNAQSRGMGVAMRNTNDAVSMLQTAEVVDQAVDDGIVRLTTKPMPPKEECDRGYGSACFDKTRLQAEDDNLILWRWDAKIRFQPRPR